jgi:hypothetical protein
MLYPAAVDLQLAIHVHREKNILSKYLRCRPDGQISTLSQLLVPTITFFFTARKSITNPSLLGLVAILEIDPRRTNCPWAGIYATSYPLGKTEIVK